MKTDLDITTPNTMAGFKEKVLERYPEAVLQKLSADKHYAVFSNDTVQHERLSISPFEGKTATTKKEAWKEAYDKVTNEKIAIESKNENSEKSYPIHNLEYLKTHIKYLGMGENEKLHKELANNIEKDSKEFSLKIPYEKTSFQNKANLELFFNKSEKTNNYYLNDFKVDLKNEKTKLDISHTFSARDNGLSAKQAINLMEGRSVLAFIKDNVSQNDVPTYISFRLKEPKHNNDNFKLQRITDFVKASILVEKSALKFDTDNHKEITIKSLEKGNIVSVKIDVEGKEIQGKAVLNPQNSTINLYNSNMQRINDNKPLVTNQIDIESKNKNTMKQSR